MSLAKRMLITFFLLNFMMGAHVGATNGDAGVFEDVPLLNNKTTKHFIDSNGRPVEFNLEAAHEPTCVQECWMGGYVCCFDVLGILCEGIQSYWPGCCEADETGTESDQTYVTLKQPRERVTS
jgi:hypothetical protein